MSRLYISSTQELPAGYTPFAATASEPQIVHHEGRKYTFLGNYQTQYSCLDRVGIGLLAFVKTFFTLGFSLILSSVRDEWSAVFTGKKIVHVYANEILSVLKGNKSEVKELSALKTMVGTLTEQGTLGGSQKRVGVFLRGYRKKAALFQKGFEQFQKMNCASSLETFRLKNGYSMSERFNSSNPLNLKCTHEFFDYAPTTGFDDYWVDFANAALGGGCFHTGFVQEEIMVAEMPDFANHIASHIDPVTKHCTISTRSGGSDRDQVMKGAPHPYLMKGLTRVLSIDSSKVYGSQFDSVSDNDLLKAAPALDPPPES